jgi:hypothetical protein
VNISSQWLSNSEINHAPLIHFFKGFVMRRILSVAAFAAALLVGNAFAQESGTKGEKAKAKWESLSPEQQEKLKAKFKDKAKEKWESMTPEEREAAKTKFKENAKARWDKMTTEEREAAKAKMKENREKRKNEGK